MREEIILRMLVQLGKLAEILVDHLTGDLPHHFKVVQGWFVEYYRLNLELNALTPDLPSPEYIALFYRQAPRELDVYHAVSCLSGAMCFASSFYVACWVYQLTGVSIDVVNTSPPGGLE